MSENKTKWEIKSHTYHLGETGDTDTTFWITNGEAKLIIEDTFTFDDGEAQELCDKLNDQHTPDYWQAERMKLINSAVSGLSENRLDYEYIADKSILIADTIIEKLKEEKK